MHERFDESVFILGLLNSSVLVIVLVGFLT